LQGENGSGPVYGAFLGDAGRYKKRWADWAV